MKIGVVVGVGVGVGWWGEGWGEPVSKRFKGFLVSQLTDIVASLISGTTWGNMVASIA